MTEELFEWIWTSSIPKLADSYRKYVKSLPECIRKEYPPLRGSNKDLHERHLHAV